MVSMGAARAHDHDMNRVRRILDKDFTIPNVSGDEVGVRRQTLSTNAFGETAARKRMGRTSFVYAQRLKIR